LKKIPLTQGKFAIVDDEDYDCLSQFKWHVIWSRRKNNRESVYASTSLRIKTGNLKVFRTIQILMHHCIVGRNLYGLVNDHINGDGLDNQRKNLRFLSVRENSNNSYKKREGISSSKYPGVHWDRINKKWRAMFYKEGRHLYLGSFINEKKAAEAYRNRLCMENIAWN